MPQFDPEQKARELLRLLRSGQSGIGEDLCGEFRTLTREQVAQTVVQLKNHSLPITTDLDSNDQVVGVNIPLSDNFSLYLATPSVV